MSPHDEKIPLVSSVLTNRPIRQCPPHTSFIVPNPNQSVHVSEIIDCVAEADTALARNYSQSLRRYLLSSSAQKDEDSFLHFQLARQTHGVCDFILKTEQYETWAQSRSSILLGVVGGSGNGKPIISAFLCGKARAAASENSLVVWLHCMPVLRATSLRLFQALI